MATSRLGNYNNYKKYGEILVISQSSVKCRNKYVLLCVFCGEISLQFKTFVQHIEQQHTQQKLHNNNDLREKHLNKNYDISQSDADDSKNNYITDFSGQNESSENHDSCNNSPESELMQKNYTLLDPLHEPEVMIVQSDTEAMENVTINQYNEKSRKEIDSHFIMEINQHKSVNNCIKTPMNKMDCNTKSKSECHYNITNVDEKYEENTNSYDNCDNNGYLSEDEISLENVKSCKFNQKDTIINDNSVLIFYKSKNAAKSMKVKTGKTKPFIEKFMSKRLNVLTLISAYHQQTDLWDTCRPSKLINRCPERRQDALTKITKVIQMKIGIILNCNEVDCLIKYLRGRYIREVRLRLKNKEDYNGADFQPLWFYEQMAFLKPTLNFMQEVQDNQLLLRTDFNEQQIITLIELYKKYPCLWNEDDIYYNFEQKRQQGLQEMRQDLNAALQMNYTLSEIESKIIFLHKVVKKEKELQIKHEKEYEKAEEGKTCKATSYESSNRFYEYFSFLMPHLGPFKCKYCPQIIPHVYTYRIHMAKHDGTKPFKCSICRNEFTQKPGYIIHLRRHIQDFPFVCIICNKGFPCKKELKRHFQNHSEYVKEYICDVCGAGFNQQKLLNWHLKVHSNIRDSVCNICGKSFTNSKLLFQHRGVHSKDKSICKLCGKSYAHYRGLSRHMVKDHETTIAAVATMLGEKPKNRVFNIYMKSSPLLPQPILHAHQK